MPGLDRHRRPRSDARLGRSRGGYRRSVTTTDHPNDAEPAVAVQRFPHSIDAIRAIRGWVEDHLDGVAPSTIESAVLLTSELATNTVLHCHTELLVVTLHRNSVVRVEIRDGCPHQVQPRHPGPHDATGRGLLIVNQVAESWGVAPTGDGKSVWFEIPAA